MQEGTILSRGLEDTAKRIGLQPLNSVLTRRQCYQHAVLLGWNALPPKADLMLPFFNYADGNCDVTPRGGPAGFVAIAALLLGLIAVAAGLVLLRSPEGRRIARGESRPAGAV